MDALLVLVRVDGSDPGSKQSLSATRAPHYAEDKVQLATCFFLSFFLSFFLLRCGICPTGVAADKGSTVGVKKRVNIRFYNKTSLISGTSPYQPCFRMK